MELPTYVLDRVASVIHEAVIVTDATVDAPGPRIVYVNRAFEEMTGYSFGEVLNRSPRLLQGPETERAVLDRLRAALEEARPFHGHTINYKKDGTPFMLEWNVEPIRGPSGRLEYFVSVQRDVTEESARARRGRQLELLHALSREIRNGGVEIDGIRRRVAETALEVTGAESAVVEEPVGGKMVYRGVAGRAEGRLGLSLPMEQTVSGICYRSQEVIECENAESDKGVLLTQKEREIGFGSALLAPLLHRQHCYGVLKVYSEKPHSFDKNHRELLTLAADILAAALFDGTAYDEELRKRQLLLDAAPILIAYIDNEQRYIEANAAHENLLGRPVSEILNKHAWEVFLGETYNRMRPYLEAALSGESVNFNVDLTIETGEERTFQGSFEPHFAPRGGVDGCYLAFRDVTEASRADLDYLTELPTRRSFERLAEFMMEARERRGTSVSLLMLDIDHFKRINDTYGHLTGDDVLKEFGRILAESTRDVDALCRWGGEEFAILLDESETSQAVSFANRLMAEIRPRSFESVGRVTASIGIATARAEESLRTLQKRADKALYEAKTAGRDRVVVSRS
jgi:diguanylate cyclase (GGDEF)-like protein/PAS domain S-box-containing protein